VIVGSLSGGCVEEDLIERIWNQDLATETPRVIEYGISAEENERLGLPCGGKLQVLVEPLLPEPARLSEFLELASALEERRCMLRHVNTETGVSRLETTRGFQALSYRAPQMTQCFGPRMRMLLVGAGALSEALSEMALAMDYEVLVNDPREDIRKHWQGPELELIGGMPDDAVRAMAVDANSIVITLTHDPRIDDMALMEALTTEAWYVGALGSARTTTSRVQRLRQLGITEEQIQRLHAPVGISIGSKTPMEIAVAIMAQLTLLRRS
jgi:xanthine dehydrogenase accessory factor